MTADVQALDNATGNSFDELPLSPFLKQTIKSVGYNSPTPIQAQSIPLIVEGHDLIGLAQTGTGKTAAFVLPLLQKLSGSQENGVRALILAPTRELAEQIHEVIKTFAGRTGIKSVTIYGGVSHRSQIAQLRSNARIVVACPGRLMDHIRGRTLDLSGVEYLILDEADRMLDMGFMPDVRAIIRELPQKRQTMLFSATMPPEVAELSSSVLSNPTTVKVKSEQPVALVAHSMYTLKQEAKRESLTSWLRENPESLAVIFTKMKHTARRLGEALHDDGIPATSLHGNLSQAKRQKALKGFKDGTFRVLIATDIASRGIDVEGVTHVLNYDMPDTLEAYIHRTGRAGRASREGQAISFVTRADRSMVRSIEEWLKTPMARLNPESEIDVDTSSSTGREPRGKKTPSRARGRGERSFRPMGRDSGRRAGAARDAREKSFAHKTTRDRNPGERNEGDRATRERSESAGDSRRSGRDQGYSRERRARREFDSNPRPRRDSWGRNNERGESSQRERFGSREESGERAQQRGARDSGERRSERGVTRGTGRPGFDRSQRRSAFSDNRSRENKSERGNAGFRGQRDIDTRASYVYQEGKSHFIDRDKPANQSDRPRRNGGGARRPGGRPQGRSRAGQRSFRGRGQRD